MSLFQVDCWNCSEGFIDGECTCGDDTCCCLEPEPPMCSECHGTGYLIVSETDDPNACPVEANPKERGS